MTDGEDDTKQAARRRPSTIIDVATEAKVAIGTVSRYLNRQPVRSGNRDQIEAAIHRLGYRRNALAAAMKSDLTNTIGFMVPMLSEYHAAILDDLSQRMRSAGRAVLAYCHNEEPHSISEALHFFAAHRVDCLVMDGHDGASEGLRDLIAGGTPVIFYDNDIPGLPVDRVLVENRAASARAVGHLFDIGHRRVGILAGDQGTYTARERLRGCYDAITAADVSTPSDYVVMGTWSEASGYSGMLRLLSLEEPPTAVYCCNYNIASGALMLLKERGLSIPNDLSLLSFDDIPLFRLYGSGITAVGQPLAAISEAVAGIIESRLSQESPFHAPQTITLDCNFILRGSVRKPRHESLTHGER